MKTGYEEKYDQRYRIGMKLVDRSIQVYRITEKLSPDSHVCPHSLHRAMLSAENYFRNGSGNPFVKIMVCDLVKQTVVYINVKNLVQGLMNEKN